MSKKTKKHPQKPKLANWSAKDNCAELREYLDFLGRQKENREYIERLLTHHRFNDK